MKAEAEGKAKLFFSLLRQEDEVKIKDVYNDFENFETYYKSDSAYVKSSFYQDGLVIVLVNSRFTNGFGKQTERDITLYFKKDTSGRLMLFDSKGMSDFSDKNEYKFGSKTGCISSSDTTDQQILNGIKKAHKVLVEEAIEVLSELHKDILVSDWSWQTLYSGSASGKGIVVNNSRFDIPSLKYTVTFKNSAGRPITTDKGTISYDAIPAGGSTSFSFYASYVGGATKASIELDFDDDLIFNYLVGKEWTGKECDEYYKTHKDESVN